VNPSSLEMEIPLLSWFAAADPRSFDQAMDAWRRYRSFREDFIDPIALKLDQARGHEPPGALGPILRSAAQQGLLSITIPRALGGGGAPMLGMFLGLEELAAGCAGLANLLTVHGLALSVMSACGATGLLVDSCQRLVSAERKGQPYLLSTAVTEPAAGTDWENLRVAAAGANKQPCSPVRRRLPTQWHKGLH
jgi:alkylation response protein AidB-like acyl-CoA dehydrogenase